MKIIGEMTDEWRCSRFIEDSQLFWTERQSGDYQNAQWYKEHDDDRETDGSYEKH